MSRESRGFPPGFRTEEVLVTPEMAKELLETMHANRSRSRMEVGLQEENLKTDSWWPEISPVFIDDDPDSARSYDAQHRFQAVVNTGISAWMLFIYGVRSEAAEYIDTGRKRTYADMLRMGEVPDYKRQSVLTRYIALYEGYGVEGVRNPSRYPVTQTAKNANLNSDAVMKSIHAGEALYRGVHANPSWAAYAAWRTGTTAEDGTFTVSPFWEKVRSGENLVKGDPALALRNWLMNGLKRDRRPADRRLMEFYAYATSWNKETTGASYQRVNPVFERRKDGSLYFPAANVPDFLPPDAGTMTRSQLRTAREAMERGDVSRLLALRDQVAGLSKEAAE
jgi:hypothetical protein